MVSECGKTSRRLSTLDPQDVSRRGVGGAFNLEMLQSGRSRKGKLCEGWVSKLCEEGVTSGDGRAGGRTRDTLIWFVVKVPVLSEQMTLVLPRVSTDGSERTMAFLRAIFFVPSARHVVMTAGRPSGMAATARATAICETGQSASVVFCAVLKRRTTRLEVVNRALDETSVARVGKVAEVDDPDEDADDGNDLGQLLAKVVDLLLQRRFFADLGADRGVNVADGSLGSGRHDERLRFAGNDGRAL